MPTKRAKTLDDEQFNRLMAFALQRSRVPASDRLKLLLSFHAGLRACEIARIKVADLTDAEGKPRRFLTVFGGIAKGGRSRTIPMSSAISEAVTEFKKQHPTSRYVAISSRKVRGRPKAMSPNAITQWFWHLYREAGFDHCSSHSGRRSFGTHLARNAHQFNQTIVDVQMLLGHARLDTTAYYIDFSENVFDLVNSI